MTTSAIAEASGVALLVSVVFVSVLFVSVVFVSVVFVSVMWLSVSGLGHPMVQEVVYRSLVSERRRALHASVAADLEKTLPDPGGAQAGFIAYHFEEAGDAAKAAYYNMKAAMWHGTRDPAQALDAWKRMRRLLLELRLDGPARYPLVLASGQIVNLAWRAGMTAAGVEPYYQEALRSAGSPGDIPALPSVASASGRARASSG